MKCIELFAGAGGAALGLEAASEAVGRIVVEADRQISEPRPQTASAR